MHDYFYRCCQDLEAEAEVSGRLEAIELMVAALLTGLCRQLGLAKLPPDAERDLHDIFSLFLYMRSEKTSARKIATPKSIIVAVAYREYLRRPGRPLNFYCQKAEEKIGVNRTTVMRVVRNLHDAVWKLDTSDDPHALSPERILMRMIAPHPEWLDEWEADKVRIRSFKSLFKSRL